jgi:hypothetical protein
MSVSNPYRKSLTCGFVVALATLANLTGVSAQSNPRSSDQIRERQNYEVIVGDFYTGRSPYFKSTGEPVVAQAKPAETAPVPAGNCSVINSGLVHMTKTMPAEATLGEPFTYELKPMAVGCAGNVVVTDQIPDGCSLVSTEPQASVSGNTLVWNLGNMDAGESKSLKVTVKPDREGTLASCATVKADPRLRQDRGGQGAARDRQDRP